MFSVKNQLPTSKHNAYIANSVLAKPLFGYPLAKQPVLADYGREVRSAISNLPPEISREFLAEYKEPTAHLVSKMEEAILSRELAIENASQESSLDRQWLEGAQKKMDGIGLSSDDEWNI